MACGHSAGRPPLDDLPRLDEAIAKLKAAEAGEPPAERSFKELMAESRSREGLDTLAIEGKRTGRVNGGVPCDVSRGPCSCGAWH
jgi:hypothetical protein